MGAILRASLRIKRWELDAIKMLLLVEIFEKTLAKLLLSKLISKRFQHAL